VEELAPGRVYPRVDQRLHGAHGNGVNQALSAQIAIANRYFTM